MNELQLNPKLEGLQIPADVQAYRRVLNIMGFDLFRDFTLIGVLDTSRAVIETDGSIHLDRDEYMDQIVVICDDSDDGAYGDGLMIRSYRGAVRCGGGVELKPYQGTPGGGTFLPGGSMRSMKRGTWGSGENAKPALIHQAYDPAWRDLNPNGTLDLLLRDVDGQPSIQKMGGSQLHLRRGDRVKIGRALGGCWACLRWKDHFELIELFDTKNEGDTCSRFCILSHWLWSPAEVVRQEYARIQAYKEACLGAEG